MNRSLLYALTVVLCMCAAHTFAQERPQAAASAPSPAPASPSACPPVAKAPTTAELQEGAAKAQDRGLLWRLRKDGRDLYLYGSLHVGRFDWVFPGPQFIQALKASDTVALELDMQAPAIQKAFKAALDHIPPLKVDAALQARLDHQADVACIPHNALAAYPPLFQAITYVVLSAREDGLDAGYAQENMLSAFAKKANKPVISLETPALQIDALIGKDTKAMQRVLDETLTQLEQHRVQAPMLRLATAWSNNRLGELQSYEQWCDCVDSEDDRTQLHKMLTGRNPNLADRIAAEHAAGKHVFAAVGALHMIGPKGLPKLLAAKGFEVELLVGQP